MPAHVLDAAPRATAVVARTTTRTSSPRCGGALLDEAYAVVRARTELAPQRGPAPVWRNVMLYLVA